MQLFGSKFYEAKDYMGKAWEKEGAQSRGKIDRVGTRHFQKSMRQAFK
jgi:hypothetical protein